MRYDFDQAFTESFHDSTTGVVTVRRTGLRTLHGEFGPKVNLGEHWHVHPFVTLKGGFMDFRVNNAPATIGTFFSSVDNLRRKSVNGVLYPGGGLEGHVGPLGIRFDIGDEIYFNSGTHKLAHRLRPLHPLLTLQAFLAPILTVGAATPCE